MSKTKNNPQNPSVAEKIKSFLPSLERVPLSQKIFFAENLRVMLRAGLSLDESLGVLSLQATNKNFRETLKTIKDDVLKGQSFASSLSRYPKIFPKFFISMIQMGEISGNLELVLAQLALQMKKEHELLSKVRGAMIYPILILTVTIAVSIAMMVYVIPNILSIFKEIKAELPLTTRILITVSDFITQNGFFLVSVVSVLFVLGFILIRTKRGKSCFHKALLKLWILGPIFQKVNLARFSRTLSSLLKVDIPVVQSFQITTTILGNMHYKNATEEMAKKLKKGISIAEGLTSYPELFSPLIVQMVTVGEKSGTTDELLEELANFYESQVDEVTKNLSTIIEPILILLLGGIVALIAFAVISPIYTLSQQI